MIAFLLVLSIFWTASVHASPNVISDSRIRDPNLTPVLGRGYSLSSNDVLSTCLAFKTTSEPTYNYDYSLLEIDSKGETTSDSKGEFAASLGWGFIRATVSGSMESTKTSNTHKQHIAVKMSMERYYSSLVDTEAELTPHALSLIGKGDIIGFFQSCGSGYIRSIRRTAEFVAVFELESTSATSVEKMAASLKIELLGMPISGGGSFSFSSHSVTSDTRMSIKIKAFGLGLNLEGSDTLVARNLDDFYNAAKFAFKSMQNHEIGMIHGIEIVSWVNNLQFQDAINFEAIERQDWKDEEKKTDPQTNAVIEVIPAGPSPTGELVQGVEVKAITLINSEFITALESFYRTQLNYILKLRNCLGELQYLTKTHSNRLLVDHTRMEFDTQKSNLVQVSVQDLFDHFDQNKVLENKFQSVSLFIKNFYSPCASRLMKTSNRGRMTKYWFDADLKTACDVECLAPNMVFQNVGSASGTNPPSKMCSLDPLLTGSGSTSPAGSGSPLSGYSNDNLIDKYCMPDLLPGSKP